MKLKKGNYYEIFCRKNFRLNPKEYSVVKYLGNHRIKYLDTAKEIDLDEDYFGFREIYIMPIHLERLGFEKKEGNLYEHNNGLKIFYDLSTLGFDSEYIGSIALREEELKSILKKVDIKEIEERYSKKFDDVNKLTEEYLQKENCIYLPPEYIDTRIKYRIELHNMILHTMVKDKDIKSIKTIEELFERLEKEGIIIEDKDKIVFG